MTKVVKEATESGASRKHILNMSLGDFKKNLVDFERLVNMSTQPRTKLNRRLGRCKTPATDDSRNLTVKLARHWKEQCEAWMMQT
eukprot:1993506-Amphidinium_carterae.1